MIGFLIALTLASIPHDGSVPDATTADRVVGKLARCAPSEERAAFRCLDRILPPEYRRVLLREKPSYSGDWLATAVEQGFGLSDRRSSISASYVRSGFPAALTNEVLLERYWLARNGCEYDHGKHVEMKQDEAADQALAIASSKEAFEQGIISSVVHISSERLAVNCRRWNEAAR